MRKCAKGGTGVDDRRCDPSLKFTPEEALGLLDIVMTSSGELSADQRAAVLKLSEFCRQCLREHRDEVNGSEDSASICAA